MARSRSRAPLVTRVGGLAVRGQRNRRPYPCYAPLSTSAAGSAGAPPRGVAGATGARAGRRLREEGRAARGAGSEVGRSR
ncbi:exported protein of unknown function [Modestobacter italicus]|uniref:Uncharacterized protein n=1 Tax=Modestobacter italicus (strain DSM 44449 / CECT 9708 / BC 501) TaxID=2732864 RepID=I4F3U8_MODI5|nr:exported protein of unknown function [Modestobacter marinus]